MLSCKYCQLIILNKHLINLFHNIDSVSCVFFMEKATSMSLQLNMLDILGLYRKNLSDCLSKSQLPEAGLKFLKSNNWTHSLAFKQKFLSTVNQSAHFYRKIISKPLTSIKFGHINTESSISEIQLNLKNDEIFLHLNMKPASFQLWIHEVKITIHASQVQKLELNR